MTEILLTAALFVLAIWLLSEGVWSWRTATRQRDIFRAIFMLLAGAHLLWQTWQYGGGVA